VRSGCAGFGEALDVARLYLENGIYQTAVVIGSEAISPLLVPLFLGKEPDAIRMRDRMNPYDFGDGAGAVVLRGGQDGEGFVWRTGAIAPGDMVMLLAIETSKWKYVGNVLRLDRGAGARADLSFSASRWRRSQEDGETASPASSTPRCISS
jgi:hypothetical protein